MEIAASQLLSKIPTGIQGFDELSRGGLPRNRTSLVMGGPGSGKTVFALQSLVNAIRQRQESGIFVVFEEDTRQIMANAATFDWDMAAVAKNKLFFLDGHLSPTVIQSGEFDLTGMLAILKAKKEEMGAGWIVFDGIDVLLALLRDSVSKMREIYRVRDWLADNEVTAIITTKIDGNISEGVNYGFMQFMVDCVIRFDQRLEHGVSVRRLQITKYRGSDFAAGEFSLSFGPSGMEVVAPEPVPRLKYTAANRVPAANSLLAALPHEEYQRLLAGLEPVTLTYGEVLYESGDPIRHVYFPNNSLVSLLTTIDGHKALEVGLVGCEGMVGIPLALGIGVSSVRALVQGTGKAMRMNSARFLEEFPQSLSFQREVYRYSHLLTSQVRQTAACNRFHTVEARLGRWLLMTRDRMRSDQFRLTHEFLADMLGVRRVGVSKAAGALRQRRLIRYSRGNIRILDQKGLEAASCGCYQILKEFDSRYPPRRAEQRRTVRDRREWVGEVAGPSRRKAIVGETGAWLDRRAAEGGAGGA